MDKAKSPPAEARRAPPASLNSQEFVQFYADGELAQARLLPRPICAACGGTGRRLVEEGGVTRAGRCRCMMLPDRVALFNLAMIPARHVHATFESFNRQIEGAYPGYVSTQQWLNRFQPGKYNVGAVLVGAPGRGKTHLLCAAVRELIFRHGVSCRFIEFTHLLSSIREGWERKDPDATTLTPLVQIPILAVDELGKGRKTDWELAVIDEIISRRYNAQGPILATTNFPPNGDKSWNTHPGAETLSERLGERAFSRLAETCDFLPVLGEDYRKVAANLRKRGLTS